MKYASINFILLVVFATTQAVPVWVSYFRFINLGDFQRIFLGPNRQRSEPCGQPILASIRHSTIRSYPDL